MTFHVGQKVVCVDASNQCDCGCFIGIEKDAIYTVTEILEKGAGVFVAEAKPSRWRYGYYARRFRPVVEPKTDISIFTKMLNPKTRTKETTSA